MRREKVMLRPGSGLEYNQGTTGARSRENIHRIDFRTSHSRSTTKR